MLSRQNYKDERGRTVITEWMKHPITDSCIALAIHVKKHYNSRVNDVWFAACSSAPRDFDIRSNLLIQVLALYEKECKQLQDLWRHCK